MSNVIGEPEKLRLTEYLLATVHDGLSGRDGKDLVDQRPDRTVFAGVLKPMRPDADVHSPVGPMPEGTALGVDFRLVPDTSESLPSIRITTAFSVYASVFPSFEQALYANKVHVASGSDEVAAPNADEADQLPDETVDPTDSDDGAVPDALGGMAALDETPDAGAIDLDIELSDSNEGDSTAPASPSTPTQVVLPRVWRRHNVEVAPILVDLPTTSRSMRTVGAHQLAAAIEQTRVRIQEDAQAWRHLDDPRQGQRTISDATMLESGAAYERRLASLGGQPLVEPPSWTAAVHVDAAPDPSDPRALRVRVLIANTTRGFDRATEQHTVDPQTIESSLFDANLSVEVTGGTLSPFEFLLAPKDYRAPSVMAAKGINCVAVAEGTAVRTETLPVFRQPLLRTRDQLQVTFEQLASSDPSPDLERIAEAMDEYLRQWNTFLATPPSSFGDEELAACAADRDAFEVEIERYRLGIECLRRDTQLARAFGIMNRTFAKLGERSGGRIRAWRLFQLGFIVSQLPALASRELESNDSSDHAHAVRQAVDDVGVLWFPTGGGKTEAYLGLIATALVFDRLRGKTRGVTAWMRFPLRMLSLQQLERLARVIATLNEMRPLESGLADGDPFAIGYFVGDANTPNSINKHAMERFRTQPHRRDRVRLLRRCPHCGSSVEVLADAQEWRLKHVCSNTECFSNTSSSLGAYLGSLPVVMVDMEIYRYLPAVLLGTVDKLAIAARQRYFTHLIRGSNQLCPRHGYTSYDECIESGSWTADCKNKKSQLAKLETIRDPGISLLIQDELHLLRDELGVFNGHYEGLIQYLGRQVYLPPKVLAATATIEAYDVQAFHIYLSRAVRYPQPAWQQGESFYATSQPLQHRRIYTGVLGHTRAIEEGALRAIALYVREVRRLQANPAKAAEVMGAMAAPPETVLDALRLYDLALAYVNRKSVAGSIEDKAAPLIEDAVLGPEELGTVRTTRLTGDLSLDEVGATLDRIESERNPTDAPRLDVVAATNLISHGVDLERINMLTVCGMPSHYAEYVQASSRAARSHPGLVFVLFKAGDPREVSQFEFFPVMHAHMERLIEPVAVNRFASNAPDKTVPGLLAALLLLDFSPRLHAERKIARSLDHIPTLLTAIGERPADTRGGTRACVDPADLLRAIVEVVGADRVRSPASTAQVDHARHRIEEAFDLQMGRIRRSLDTRLPDAIPILTSFRDIDEGLEFASLHSAGLVERLS